MEEDKIGNSKELAEKTLIKAYTRFMRECFKRAFEYMEANRESNFELGNKQRIYIKNMFDGLQNTNTIDTKN